MNEQELLGDVIYTYTRDQAVKDGVLIELGIIGSTPVYATTNCFYRAGLDNPLQRIGVVLEAIEALKKQDVEDTSVMKLRVLHKGIAADYECLWVIQDCEAITIMFPEDY